MHPCPALLDEKEKPYGPIRTNIFPLPQVTLASAINQNHEVKILDARTIVDPQAWKNCLTGPYAPPIEYGESQLGRYLVGHWQHTIFGSAKDVDAYVLSANFTYEANAVKSTIKALREHNPSALILVGGSDAAPVERRQFYFDAGTDYIGIGDSDLSLPQFLHDVEERIAAEKYPMRIIPAAGKIHLIDPATLAKLDLSRFSESGGGEILESIAAKGTAVYLEAQRGCNRTCDFCSAAKTPFDRLSVTDVKRQIDIYLQQGVALFMFTDDNLLLRKSEELREIFDYLCQRGAAWEFPNGLDMALLNNKPELRAALFWNNGDRENYAGIHRLLFPLEDLLLRETNLQKLRDSRHLEALEDLVERDVPYVNIGIMIGAPNETAKERDNLQLALESIAQRCRGSDTKVNYSFFCTMPLPGTRFGQQMKKEGRIAYDINETPELWNVFTSVINGDNFSSEQTTAYRRELLGQYKMQQDSGKVGTDQSEKVDVLREALVLHGAITRNTQMYTQPDVFWQQFGTEFDRLIELPHLLEFGSPLDCHRKVREHFKPRPLVRGRTYGPRPWEMGESRGYMGV